MKCNDIHNLFKILPPKATTEHNFKELSFLDIFIKKKMVKVTQIFTSNL